MALRQTRRSISISELVYLRARHLAAVNNQTLAHYTESALLAYGVDAPAGMHQTPTTAAKAKRMRMVSAREVTRRVSSGMVRK